MHLFTRLLAAVKLLLHPPAEVSFVFFRLVYLRLQLLNAMNMSIPRSSLQLPLLLSGETFKLEVRVAGGSLVGRGRHAQPGFRQTSATGQSVGEPQPCHRPGPRRQSRKIRMPDVSLVKSRILPPPDRPKAMLCRVMSHPRRQMSRHVFDIDLIKT